MLVAEASSSKAGTVRSRCELASRRQRRGARYHERLKRNDKGSSGLVQQIRRSFGGATDGWGDEGREERAGAAGRALYPLPRRVLEVREANVMRLQGCPSASEAATRDGRAPESLRWSRHACAPRGVSRKMQRFFLLKGL